MGKEDNATQLNNSKERTHESYMHIVAGINNVLAQNRKKQNI